jgi:hypothetical protein
MRPDKMPTTPVKATIHAVVSAFTPYAPEAFAFILGQKLVVFWPQKGAKWQN